MSRSSFAQSFFQSGGEQLFVDDNHAAKASNSAAAAASIGDSGTASPEPSPARGRGLSDSMERRKSRRQLLRGSGRSSRDILTDASVAAAESEISVQPSASSSIDGEADSEKPVMIPRPESAKRQHSWYQDALLQGGGSEDLAAIFGEDVPPVGDNGPIINDEEVLEQYRIMAHVEASIRVKENTGFDMADFEQNRKMHPESHKEMYFSGERAAKPRLPEFKRITPTTHANQSLLMKPQEPTPPTNSVRSSFVQNAFISRDVPELCLGMVMQGSTAVPKGEHIVRCLGCQSKLHVNLLATLVRCTGCSTVSPASSARQLPAQKLYT